MAGALLAIRARHSDRRVEAETEPLPGLALEAAPGQVSLRAGAALRIRQKRHRTFVAWNPVCWVEFIAIIDSRPIYGRWRRFYACGRCDVFLHGRFSFHLTTCQTFNGGAEVHAPVVGDKLDGVLPAVTLKSVALAAEPAVRRTADVQAVRPAAA